jgi:hypothetical protein
MRRWNLAASANESANTITATLGLSRATIDRVLAEDSEE